VNGRISRGEISAALDFFSLITRSPFSTAPLHSRYRPSGRFSAERVDAAVLECGLGGIADAANVASDPRTPGPRADVGVDDDEPRRAAPGWPPRGLAAALVTSLGTDHATALGLDVHQSLSDSPHPVGGEALARVAAAKVGTARPGRPLVICRQPSIEAEAAALAAASTAADGLAEVVRAWEWASVVPATAAVRGATSRYGDEEQKKRGDALEAFRLLPALDPQGPPTLLRAAVRVWAAAVRGPGGVVLAPELSLDAVETPLFVGAAARGCLEGALAVLQRWRAAALAAAREAGSGGGGGSGGDDAPAPGPDAEGVARALETAFLPCRLQVLALRPDGPTARPVHVVLDGAHTREAASRLSSVVASLFGPRADVALVLATAADKDVAGVCRGLLEGGGRFVEAQFPPIGHGAFGGGGGGGGGGGRGGAPGAALAAWQAARIEARSAWRAAEAMVDDDPAGPPAPPSRCREQLAASVAVALHRCVAELAARPAGGVRGGSGGQPPPRVVVVTGSLHAAAEGLRAAADAGALEGWLGGGVSDE